VTTVVGAQRSRLTAVSIDDCNTPDCGYRHRK